jgi:CPA2 family monovalent cation:H+ antiporter-2
MIEHPALFQILLLIFLTSLVCVVAFQRLNLPDTLAYLLAGILLGPNSLGWVNDSEEIHFLSELGVTFLLFELGLEFSLRRLLNLRRSVFGLGSLQVTLTVALLAGIVYVTAEEPWWVALVAGGTFALSSTAIVTRELQALQLINRHHAQLAIGVLIFQDLAAIVLLILIPSLAGPGTTPVLEQLGLIVMKSMALIIILLSAGKWLLPPLFREIAKAGSDDVFGLTTLVIALVSAWLTSIFGLSMTLGAFVVGVMLGESEFRHQVQADIRSFKDILMGLFFVSIGMRVDLELVADQWQLVLTGILTLILLKTFVVSFCAMLMGETATTATKTGVMLAQASEFGFVLLAMADQLGLMPEPLGSLLLLIAIGSIAVAPFLIRYSFEISRVVAWLAGRRESPQQGEIRRIPPHLANHVILAGYGRVGRTIAKLLRANDVPFIALDIDLDQVKRGRQAGDPVIYGSCARVDLLKRCYIDRARLAILTFKSLQEARRAVSHIRTLGYTIPIMVRTAQDGNLEELISAGADHVIPEMLESGLFMAAQVLTLLGLPKAVIDDQIEAERKLNRPPSSRQRERAES